MLGLLLHDALERRVLELDDPRADEDLERLWREPAFALPLDER